MKKLFFVVSLALSVLVGCKNAPIDEQVSQFMDEVAKMNDDAAEAYQAITDEIEQDAFVEKFYDEMKDKCLSVIRKNKDNELGLAAFKEVFQILDPEELESTVKMLGAKISEDQFISSVKQGIASKKATAEGCKFTDFEVDGVKFSDFVGKGKYVLVDFWASWCGPCKREIPNIAAVYEKYHGEDFNVLSIAVWDKPEDTVKAAAEHGVVWDQIINAQKIPTDIYGIDGIPHIMLIGPDGTILKRDLRGADIEKAVSEALGR